MRCAVLCANVASPPPVLPPPPPPHAHTPFLLSLQLLKLMEANPEVTLLALNYEDNRTLVQTLGVKVLPWFVFFRWVEEGWVGEGGGESGREGGRQAGRACVRARRSHTHPRTHCTHARCRGPRARWLSLSAPSPPWPPPPPPTCLGPPPHPPSLTLAHTHTHTHAAGAPRAR